MTTDNFCFYLQNRLIQTSQTGGQRYSDTSPFSIPCKSTSATHKEEIIGIKFKRMDVKLCFVSRRKKIQKEDFKEQLFYSDN
jgi:hypothetical protein